MLIKHNVNIKIKYQCLIITPNIEKNSEKSFVHKTLCYKDMEMVRACEKDTSNLVE